MSRGLPDVPGQPPLDAAPGSEESPGRVISIIVPCWRDDALPVGSTERWMRSGATREVFIAVAAATPERGGPVDKEEPERPSGYRVIHCPKAGRGSQMNEADRKSVV